MKENYSKRLMVSVLRKPIFGIVFFVKDVELWQADQEYQCVKATVVSMRVVNNITERE